MNLKLLVLTFPMFLSEPDVQLTEKDLILIMNDYEIVRTIFPPIPINKDSSRIYYGFANHKNKKVYVNEYAPDSMRHKALIHEALHIKTQSADENYIIPLTEKEYKRIFTSK